MVRLFTIDQCLPRVRGYHVATKAVLSMSLLPAEPVAYRVLLVDDDAAVRDVMIATLEHKGFEVIAAANVIEALGWITTQKFDALITDLHMPDPGDGFTVVTAMRHSQPGALTLIVSGYPDVKQAMETILLEADEILVKPFEIAKLAELLREKMVSRKPVTRSSKERVGAVLRRSIPDIIENWLARAKQNHELRRVELSDAERTGHLSKLVEDVARRLSLSSASDQDSDAKPSATATSHGELRFSQGYSPAMLVHESRLLQVAIFGTLQNNLNFLDFSLLLPDVMAIADEIDSQLTQSMDGYMKLMPNATAA